MKLIITFLFIICLFLSPVSGQDLRLLSQASLVGSGVLKYLFWDIYEAQLYAPNRTLKLDSQFALKLIYLKSFKGQSIAERSIQEMREGSCKNNVKRQSWLEGMQAIFPDVEEGTSLVGVKTDEGYTRFYKNLELVGEIKDAKFSECFFSIWLGPNTSEPTLRKNLLGIN